MNWKKMGCGILAVAMISLLTACGGGKEMGDQVTLNVLNWDDYMAPEVLTAFEQKYPDIKVNMVPLTSNEEMYTVLSQEDNLYDVCFPSDYTIEKLVANGLLEPLDKSKIPNMEHIMPRCMDLDFDKGNVYSVPYMWGTVGILYNEQAVSDVVDSWEILWDEKYKGQILMYDSVRDAMAVANKKLGYSVNTASEEEIRRAGEELVRQKPLNQSYGTDELKNKMITESAAMAVVYSGDAVFAMAENENLRYVVPKEGSNLWFDNMVIMKSSKQKDAAHTFINFLNDPEIAKINTEYIGYTTANQAGFNLLEEELQKDPVYMPSKETLDRCEVYLDLGEKIKLYDEIWTKLKASK